jgi:thioredoxin-related protein
MARFVLDFELGGFEHISDPGGQVWSVFGVTAQPSYAFVNDSGEITRQVGALPDEDFLAIIEELTQN